VADAEILLAPGREPELALVASHTDAAGRFALRDVAPDRYLAAAAAGWAVARLQPIARVADPGSAQASAVPAPTAPPDGGAAAKPPAPPRELRFDAPGLAVTGRVLAADRSPVAGALVVVGMGLAPDLGPAELAQYRPPRWARSGLDGSFLIRGVPFAPEAFVWARAPSFAPRCGPVTLDPHRGADVDLVLQPGWRVAGTVLDDDGRPAAGARLSFRDAVYDVPEA